MLSSFTQRAEQYKSGRFPGRIGATGKPHGADAARGKATYPSLMGMDNAKRRADALYDEALQALGTFGDAAEPLRWMARAIVHCDR